MVQFDLLPFPTGNSRNKSNPSDPGLGLFEAVLSPGKGVGQTENVFSLILLSMCHFSRSLHYGCGSQDYVFLTKNAGICRRVVGEE